MLEQLRSSDPETRKNALWELFGNIWHQHTVYPATAPAVPFLVELALSDGPQDRAGILQLLVCIATGTGYLEVHEPIFASWDVDLGGTDEARAAEANAVTAARAAVASALPRLLPLANDPDIAVRATLAALAAAVPSGRDLSLPALRRLRDEDADDRVRTVARGALFVLGEGAEWPLDAEALDVARESDRESLVHALLDAAPE